MEKAVKSVSPELSPDRNSSKKRYETSLSPVSQREDSHDGQTLSSKYLPAERNKSSMEPRIQTYTMPSEEDLPNNA